MRLAPRALLVLLACLTALPATASAGTVRVRTEIRDRTGDLYGTVAYRAVRGESNRLEISVVAGAAATVEDAAGVRAGPGCRQVNRTSARCVLQAGWASVDVAVRLGDRNDRARVGGAEAIIRGGSGRDAIRAPAEGATIEGGSGNDRLRGGTGSDAFHEGRHRSGRDTIAGGGGFDEVSYARRRRRVRADLAGDRDDGERRERDRIGRDVESLRGGSGADNLTGSGAPNAITGGGGSDRISGRGGDDDLSAGDEVGAFDGTGGRNRVAGGSGNDDLIGSEGNDRLSPGPGFDTANGGPGSDLIASRDSDTDLVYCDNGGDRPGRRDRAKLDELDFHGSGAGCNTLTRQGTARGVFIGYEDAAQEHIIGVDAADGKALVSIGCSSDGPARCTGSVELFEGARSLGSASFSLRRGASEPTVDVPLSPADFARADSRAGINATLVVRPTGAEERRTRVLLRSESALYRP